MRVLDRVQPTKAPSPEKGVGAIKSLIEGMHIVEALHDRDLSLLFERMYSARGLSKHLLGKYKGYEGNFNGFFLNMDEASQCTWLYRVCSKSLDLVPPSIPHWYQLAEQLSDLVSGAKKTEELVRKWAPGFNLVSKWDVFPHDYEWIRRFLLYFNNTGIYDDRYTGEKYGNWQNWSVYFTQLSAEDQLAIARKLITYA